MYEELTAQAKQAVTELLDIAKLKPGKLFVVGCSSSEMVGARIGKGSSLEAAQAAFAGIYPVLQARGIELGKGLFVKFCRVGASDHIGELTGCELVCMLVGERPGLVTNESMSAYLTYKPYRGIPESKRTVVSNIHRQGVPAVEAGAHIASLIEKMLKQKTSGIDLVQEALS